MDEPLQKRIVSDSEQRGRWIRPVWALAPPLTRWAPHLISLPVFSAMNVKTTISIHRIVECKGENVLENTSKTLKLGWSYSKYLSGYQNIFTHWLFFPLPVSHTRKIVEVKSKLPFCCQSVLGWFLHLAAHQNHPGALVPPRGNCHCPSGVGLDLETATS